MSENADTLVESVKHLIMELDKDQVKQLLDWINVRYDTDGNEHPYNAGA